MNQHLEQIRDQQEASWSKHSAGWKKWDALTMAWLKPVGDAMIDALQPRRSDVVLEVACGTGEPGLSIATLVPDGRVVMTDLSADMLAITHEHAAARGITNITTQPCDVSELPFDDNTFDAISCRFGFMFFPDMGLAARELKRVLKPGGRLATAVWYGAGKNPWVTSIMQHIARLTEMPPTPPDAPHIFRCAADDMMTDLLRTAGFTNATQTEIENALVFDSIETYWNMMTDVSAPIAAALNNTDAATQAAIKRDVFAALEQRFGKGPVTLASSALVISAR